jgi:hypothetical protein
MAKIKIKHTITKKEWNKKHKDFKTTIDGVPYIMMYNDKDGTYLAPVKIVEATDAEEQEFHSELDKLVHKTFGKSAEEEEMDESVNEGSFSEIDIMAKAARNFNDFVKEFYKDFKDFPKDKDTLKWLKSLYAGRSAFESVNEMDINDPIMMKLRAAQMKRNKDAAKKIEKQKKINPDYKALKNATKIKALKKKRAEVMRDMEQEAEPEGGKIADRYGKLLNRIDNDIIKLGGNPMSESVNEAYVVMYAKKKGEKPASAAFQLRGSALSFERDLKKDGYITMVTQKKVKGIDESVNENDGVYFKSYTAAIEAARAAALKKGFEVEDDEMFTKVGMNSKRPSVGKTTRVSLELIKNGKPQRKMLHIQVYGMKNGYELNSYIN